jgi:alpha-2-macroglobulin
MWPGRHQIRYLARVRATGSATAPPAKIEEMYHPERFGLSDSIVVKGKAL